MRTPPNPGILRTVHTERLRVVVEIEPGEPVCGSAAREGEPQVPFEGMLGFLTLFDRLRTRDDSPEPGQPDAQPAPADAGFDTRGEAGDTAPARFYEQPSGP